MWRPSSARSRCRSRPSTRDPDATANARLSARLPYLFASCRFAHYLKCMVRDKVGSFKERADMERYLSDWIKDYVLGNPGNAGDELKAQKPLAGAEVKVEEVEGNPGYYSARVLPAAALPARRRQRDLEPGFAAAVAEERPRPARSGRRLTTAAHFKLHVKSKEKSHGCRHVHEARWHQGRVERSSTRARSTSSPGAGACRIPARSTWAVVAAPARQRAGPQLHEVRRPGSADLQLACATAST